MMKNIFVLFIIFILCNNVNAQEVLGVNIKTTMQNFKREFARKGYKPNQTAEGEYKYSVKYAGYPNCTAIVDYNVETDSIWKLVIDFPYESYDKSLDILNNLIPQFEAKYGAKKEKDYSR